MSQQLGYGLGRSIRLDVGDDSLPGPSGKATEEIIQDPRRAVQAAMREPLGFPDVHRALVPDDQIVLVVPPAVPQVAELTAGIIECLLQSEHVTPDDIRIVFDGRYHPGQLVEGLPSDVAEKIVIERHDPTDADVLSYLSANEDGQAIYMNRSIVDADVVIPLGVMQLDGSLDYTGVQGDLFPTFSNTETRLRFKAAIAAEEEVLRERRRAEAAEAVWLLGSSFTIQIIPGPGDEVLHVLAGDRLDVQQQGQPLCRGAWQRTVSRRPNLVVAAIEGDEQHQTWTNVARALFAARQVVDENGAIVLCTRLRDRPGPSLQRLADSQQTLAETLREIRRDRSEDALPAAIIAEVLDRVRIYLLSELDDAEVESLGLVPVANEEEISRLIQERDDCLILANAHYTAVSLSDAVSHVD